MYQEIIKKIKEADMILVGIGEQVSSISHTDYNIERTFEEWKEIVANNNDEKVIEFFNNLSVVFDKKNYFFITTNCDGCINESNINPLRIVAPCGNVKKLQSKCTDKIIDCNNFYLIEDKESFGECKGNYEPNVYNKKHYNENGYLHQWELYNKWLSYTLNRNLLILEIGCGFSMMSLIRIPFEKITLINEKAQYYRINNIFPQITAELKGKMTSIDVDPFIFAQELKNAFLVQND